MSRNIIIMVITSSFLFISSAGSAIEPNYVPSEVLVRFKLKDNGEQRSAGEKAEILSSLGGGSIVRSYKLVPELSLVKLPQGISVESALATFGTSSDIIHIQPNYIYHAFSTFPNDPCGPVPNGGDQWGLHNTGQTGGTPDADIDAPEAWYITRDSNIIVAVIDSGVDYTHPDLSANMWTDSNGSFGYDFYNNDSDPMDDNGHGTHCAGIIGAVGNNSQGVTGVCWNVKIMALKFLNDLGEGGSTANAISCIEYAIDKGAKVLSNSWGSYEYDQELKDAIDVANAMGVLFIAAAGNDGYSYPSYPARFDCSNIISVMASDSNDVRSIWASGSSNWGLTSVDLAAPGSNILSCAVYGQYNYKDGTSMSTPFVAGAAALVWSINPTLIHLNVKDIILNSVDQKSALNGLCVTGGRLNLFNALAIANALGLSLNKVDNIADANGVLPGNDVNYTISYLNPPVGDPNYIGTINDVVITDLLPDDLAFISASGPNSVYHPSTHTVTWNIGTLEPNESNSVTLTAKVNDCIPSYGSITNLCKISGGNYSRWTREHTPVLCASNPNPTCGELSDFLCTGEPNLNLTWCSGYFAAALNGHEIYFGTNFNDVNDANNSWPLGEVYKGPVSNPSYPIEANKIELGTTYYWRIDEVNDSNVWRGSVWGFTTDCYLIDNFNKTYGAFYPDRLRDTWKDYWTQDLPYTCAIVSNVSGPSRSGYSMRYNFLNYSYGPYYSEARADVNTAQLDDLGKDPNWLDMGAKVLSLWFYGIATNDANQQMYVKLTDGEDATGKVEYPYMSDITEEEWHQWNIVLQDFVDDNDVNLADVKKIIIGFGDGTPAESDGTVFFEDIRLYLGMRCFPGCYPVGDFKPDCVVDFYDFAVFAQAWLTSSEQPDYNPVCDISVPHNDIIDMDDLARFCDYWLLQLGEETSMGDGFGGAFYASSPQQPQIELQPEPESQPPEQSAPEPPQPEPELQPEPQPQPQAEQIEEEIDEEEINNNIECLQELLSDEQLKEMMIEEQGEQAWQEFAETLQDWLEELNAQL